MIYEGIKIEGNIHIKDPDFSNKVKSALELLNKKANEEFLTLKNYSKLIRAAQRSGANFNEKEMTIDIAADTFNTSLEWLASVLIHENRHLQKYKDTSKKFGDAHLMRDKTKALQVMIDEELECNKIQCSVLRKIGGKAHEVDYLSKLKGDHFDVNKDGKYDEADYGARNW